MDKEILNFESFELPFFNEVKDQQSPRSNLEILLSNLSNKVKENMESRIPPSAIYLGTIATEIENVNNTWITRDEYYIYPLQNDEYNWAVFRISWDDNFGRWDWSPD